MSIVVEGMDQGGKTTLARYLAHVLGWDLKHSPSKMAMENPAGWNEWTREAIGSTRIVYDRFPVISEAVYGPILRGKNLVDGTDFLAKFIQWNPLIIYCRPPLSILLADLTEQMEGVAANRLKLSEEYDQFMAFLRRVGFRIHEYDFTSSPVLQGLVSQIRSYNSRRES